MSHITFDLSIASIQSFATLLSFVQGFDPQHQQEIQIRCLLGLAGTVGVELERNRVKEVTGRQMMVDSVGPHHELCISFRWLDDDWHDHVRVLRVWVDTDNSSLKGELQS